MAASPILVLNIKPGPEKGSHAIIQQGEFGRVTGSNRRGTRIVRFESGIEVDSVLLKQLEPPGVLDRIVTAISDV